MVSNAAAAPAAAATTAAARSSQHGVAAAAQAPAQSRPSLDMGVKQAMLMLQDAETGPELQVASDRVGAIRQELVSHIHN